MTIKSQIWPGTNASCTLNVNFYRRANEGVGSYSTCGDLGLSALTLAVVGGAASGTTLDLVYESVVQHVMNASAMAAWYNPENATLESSLRKALYSKSHLGVAPAVYVNVFFDGQFGSVLVG